MPHCRFLILFLSALVLLLAAPLLGQAQEDPLPGKYVLQADDNEGEMTVTWDANEQVYSIEIFTTNDDAMHFCDSTGRYFQEAQALVRFAPQEKNPFIIMIRDNGLEILEEDIGNCGMNQSMKGLYVKQ